jgi:hypothetical protein
MMAMGLLSQVAIYTGSGQKKRPCRNRVFITRRGRFYLQAALRAFLASVKVIPAVFHAVLNVRC